ncbi:DUF397 domain-containing protein [Streptomyces asoensis]|uniref:DUF397 domain-containing protein n=1 Tax=Streptomyces asoensis TaxID=249586 RepID=A0ABQ3RZI0_9ACTN|nr:DUF397 domain-containing protein [Streptomyces asoensis]GGQ50138.1 DUF397 domain-containing protein [Streptomyces asoensis]GHI61271.1 DUF397 domain-containing protein [Streptomyces asoensis]
MSAGPQPDSEPVWFKSSYSGGNTTECVETAFVAAGVLVRDSKEPGGPRIQMSAEAWRKFLVACAR